MNNDKKFNRKIKYRAWKDFWYMIGVWIVMRYNKIGAGELLEKWGKALQHQQMD